MNLKKLYLLTLTFIFVSSCTSNDDGPVYEGDLVISTMEQYNRFDYEYVFGTLTIENLNSPDLLKLNSLTDVGGLIIRNSAMTSLNGLDNLKFINKDLILENNQNLETICCLNKVDQVGSLQIIDHPQLTSISGLSGIKTVNDTLRIRSAPQLGSLNGLQNLKTVNAPFNLNEIGIQSLEGLESLEQIESLYFKRLESLTNATEWTQLQIILNDLEIIECTQLTTINTPNLRVLPSIFLGSNPSLTDVDFGAVSNDMDFVGIGGAPFLQSIRGLEYVIEIGQLDLTELVSLQDLLGFSGLTTVRGNLQLNNLASLTSLQGLDNLVSAAMDYSGDPVNYTEFTISGLDGLTSLNGLNQLQSVGQMNIRNNDNLSSLDGTALQSTIPWGCRLFVENNSNLSDFCGFSTLANSVNFNSILISGNAYNPTVPQIRSENECSQ